MSNNQQLTAIDTEYGASHGTLVSYVVGFVLSIVFTLLAYILVSAHIFTGGEAIAIIILLAIGQLLVQLVFFLHLSKKSHARWNLTAFVFSAVLVVILVVGTIWIMSNLSDNMTTSFIKNTSVLTAF